MEIAATTTAVFPSSFFPSLSLIRRPREMSLPNEKGVTSQIFHTYNPDTI
jgi:hypothetical protein